MRKAVIVAGVLIDIVLDLQEAVDRVEDLILEGRASGRSHQVATINTQFIVNAWRNRAVRNILHSVDLATCDGTPVLWACRWLGAPLRNRVTGVDLVPELAKRAAQKQYRVFLFGGKAEVATKTATVLTETYPDLEICGTLSPDNVQVETIDPEHLAAIKAARPDILLVALGNPKQEQWISLYADALGVPVSIGVGGTFDFIAGTASRAPKIVQNFGFEWLYRLAHEPSRLWRRYLDAAIWFPFIFMLQLWQLLRLRVAALMVRDSDPVGTSTSVSGYLTAGNSERLYGFVKQSLVSQRRVALDIGNVVFIDSIAMGALLLLCAESVRSGTELHLLSVPAPVRRLIEAMNLDLLLRASERRA